MRVKIDTADGFLTPLIVCDECGEPIRDARDGNYHWQADGDGPGPGRRFAFFTHKACCDAFERGRGGAAAWYAMELADLVPSLLAGLRIDPSAGHERVGVTRG